MLDIGRGILGVFVLLLLLFLFSSSKKKIDWRLVVTGIALQVIFALLILKVEPVRDVFNAIARGFVVLLNFTEAGANFVFGKWPGSAVVTEGFTGKSFEIGYVFAFKVLPTIVFFAALSSLLYYLGILQKIVYVLAWLMSKTMRLSGSESLAAAANVFIGQTEAPLIVKPYLDNMTKSEILCLMTGGMATIAGGVFAAFVGFLGGENPVMQSEFAAHLLTASIMSAPAAIVAAKMLFPELHPEKINRNLDISKEQIGVNALDAITTGTRDGIKLAVNVGAMLLVFIAMIAMVNYLFKDMIGEWTGWNEQIVEATSGRFAGFTLEYIFGLVFAPFAWVLGVPSGEVLLVGQLLGEKTIINEFVAYASLRDMIELGTLDRNSKATIIATYALCGFANFSSIGIQIGGIGAIAPQQRKNLSQFGIKALIGGTIACFLTATIAGMLI